MIGRQFIVKMTMFPNGSADLTQSYPNRSWLFVETDRRILKLTH